MDICCYQTYYVFHNGICDLLPNGCRLNGYRKIEYDWRNAFGLTTPNYYY